MQRYFRYRRLAEVHPEPFVSDNAEKMAKSGAQHAAVGDNENPIMPRLKQYVKPLLDGEVECPDMRTAGEGEIVVLCCPAVCLVRIFSLHLVEAEPLPQAEIDLPHPLVEGDRAVEIEQAQCIPATGQGAAVTVLYPSFFEQRGNTTNLGFTVGRQPDVTHSRKRSWPGGLAVPEQIDIHRDQASSYLSR